jgi:hypothetical protein
MPTENAIFEVCKAGDLAQILCWFRVETCRGSVAAAVANNHLSLMRLLDLGADVNAATANECLTALYVACSYGHLDAVRCLLVELNADVNQEDRLGGTALSFAANSGNVDLMRCLVREGNADINHVDRQGETALLTAAWNKHATLCKWLVKAGADPQAKNTQHKTAADISQAIGASPEQTAYLEAKAHCAYPCCSGAGTKKCQGCMQGRYCGPACHMAHWPAHRAECRRLGVALKSA